MPPREKTCLILLAVCTVWLATSFGKTQPNFDDNVGDGEYGGLIRRKRAGGYYHPIGAPVLKGIVAVKKLIKGAKAMDQGDTVFQLYRKLGTYDKALKDFKRLRPESVKSIQGPNGEQIVTGVKGDREIVLTKVDANKPNQATIEIKKLWELNGEKTERITHKIFYE